MKTYSVTLSNDSCVFDSRDEIPTAEEAVAFASGRGSSYRVYVSTVESESKGIQVMATYHTLTDLFAVDVSWYDAVNLTPAQFADHIRANL